MKVYKFPYLFCLCHNFTRCLFWWALSLGHSPFQRLKTNGPWLCLETNCGSPSRAWGATSAPLPGPRLCAKGTLLLGSVKLGALPLVLLPGEGGALMEGGLQFQL